MLKWWEREHEEEYCIVRNDPNIVMALRECDFLKLLKVRGMRAQLVLLEHLVRMWDVNEHIFHVGVHTFTLEIDEIYFLISLSRHGSRVSLSGGRGGAEPMDYYVANHCSVDTEKHSGKVPIKNVLDLSLRTIIFTITCVSRSETPYMALQSQFQYAIECMEPRVFNWCEGLLKNMKKQLTKCRTGRLKQFGYRSILVSFFLERVPLLCLKNVDWGVLAPQDPRMRRWVDLMAHHGGGPAITYGPTFSQWSRDQLIMIKDYTYAGVDFHGDPDLALPEGSRWGEIGKKYFFHYILFLAF
jgi:hypothetical protein